MNETLDKMIDPFVRIYDSLPETAQKILDAFGILLSMCILYPIVIIILCAGVAGLVAGIWIAEYIPGTLGITLAWIWTVCYWTFWIYIGKENNW